MANDWIRVQKDTPDKPEVVAMAVKLGLHPDVVFTKCFRVWSWFDSHSADGVARGTVAGFLDSYVNTPGFSDALREVGWLQVRESSLVIPHFSRHMGESAKKRASDAERQRKSRAKRKGDGVTVSQKNCDTVTKKCDASSLLFSSSLDPSSSEMGGAGGAENSRAGPVEARPLSPRPLKDFGLTAEGLSQEWAFLCRRTVRGGVAADGPLDKAGEIGALLDIGHDPKAIQDAMRDTNRDKGEHFWQFKQRFVDQAKGDKPCKESTESLLLKGLEASRKYRRGSESGRGDTP